MRCAPLLLLGLLAAPPAFPGTLDRPPTPSGGVLCQSAIEAAEKAERLPPRLLSAIGLVESGRFDARSGRVLPWPWSVNIAGTDHVFETQAEAIAAVQSAQAIGVLSIDVGCMQVNMMYHPAAFASLDEAFDPVRNAVYAARFLNRLFVLFGDWRRVAAAYHSQTPGMSDAYAERVMAVWPLASQYVLPEPPSPPPDTLPPGLGRLAALPDATPEMRRRQAENLADRARWVVMGVLSPSPGKKLLFVSNLSR